MTKTMHKKLRELLIAYPDLPIIANVYMDCREHIVKYLSGD